jgi:Flp pilus assembly protein TadD
LSPIHHFGENRAGLGGIDIAAMRTWVRWTGLVVAGATLVGCQDGPEKSISSALDATLRQSAAQATALGGWPEALTGYRLLYERNPDDADAALGYVRALRNVGQADEAVRVGALSVVRYPDDARLLGEYGKARLAARDLPGAVETLTAAITRSPADWSLHSALGITYDLVGQHEMAQDAYLKALDVSPNNPTVTNNLALSLALSGNLDGAIARLEHVGPPLRGSVQARQSLALLYAMKGQVTRAEPLVRKDLPARVAEENLAFFERVGGARPAVREQPTAVSLPAEEPLDLRAPTPAPSQPRARTTRAARPRFAEPQQTSEPGQPATIVAAPMSPAPLPAPQRPEPADGPSASVAAAAEPAEPASEPRTADMPIDRPNPVEAQETTEPEQTAVASGSPIFADAPVAPERIEAVDAPSPPPSTTPDTAELAGEPKTAPVPMPSVDDIRPTDEIAAPTPQPVEQPAAAAPAPRASAKRVPALPPGPVRLQIGAMRTEKGARIEWERLRSKYGDLLGTVDGELSRAESRERGTFWRIWTDPIDDAGHAEQLCDELRRRRAGCLLVRI